MIVNLGGRRPGGIADRLLAALERRGHEVAAAPAGEAPVLFFCPDPLGPEPGPRALEARAGARRLVVTRIGTHRDARHPALRACWDWEERARAGGEPVLTLRLAPLLGPACPLWRRLGGGPVPGALRHKLVNPVAEADAVETIARALDGRAAWQGWYEVAGPEPWTLGELRDLARSAAPAGPGGAWEPPLEELREHRLAEAGPWVEHFGLAPRPLAEAARAWAAAGEKAA